MEVIVLGAGESGVGAAILAKQKGQSVFVSDRGAIKEIYKRELEEQGIEYEENQHSEQRILQADLVIKSPGIPDHVALIKKLVGKGIPVISEIEYAGRFTNGKIIGITGSNGKTTTTKLAYHLLKQADYDVAMVGNVGISFAKSIASTTYEYYVLELSSFQLDGIVHFRPDIALLLNITPDHLDRYDYEMDKYIAAKFRITENQTHTDHFLFNADDQNISKKLKNYPVRAVKSPISREGIKDTGVVIDGSYFELTNTQLIGMHNYMNALFAIKAVKMWGMEEEAIQKGLESFVPVEHRMERLGYINQVEYINDSKATNVDAAYYALDAMDKTIIWIAGGQDKGNDYEQLKPLVAEKARAMICLGAENEALIHHFGSLVDTVVEVKTADDAVSEAMKLAQKGEAVLLSPACASFDLFDNYEQRGQLFKEAVLKRINNL
jgi:UDP-N-acetylmuramoylalanine--D-glutamate ligase